jgi:hypothetical protein
MSGRAPSRRDNRIQEQLDSGESLHASATFNTGSVLNAALAHRSAPIVRLVVTDRRLILFATNNLALNFNLGDLLLSIPLSDIDRIESATFRPMGISALRMRVILRDKQELSFEASGFTASAAKKLVPILEDVVASRHGGGDIRSA